MKQVPVEIAKIIRQWLPLETEDRNFEFTSEDGANVNISISRHPRMSGFIICFEEAMASVTTYSFFSIIPSGQSNYMRLWFYGAAEERRSAEGIPYPKEWTTASEIPPGIDGFDAHLLNLLGNSATRDECFRQGLERLSELVSAASPEISKPRLR